MTSIRDQIARLQELKNLDESSQREIYQVAEQVQSSLNLQSCMSLKNFHLSFRVQTH